MAETELIDQAQHVIFLGLAEHWQDGIQPFPIGSVDIYQISRNKMHIVYPGIINSNQWVFLISSEFLRTVSLKEWSIRISDENDIEVGTFRIQEDKRKLIQEIPMIESQNPYALYYSKQGNEYTFLHYAIPGTIQHPGQYTIRSILKGKVAEVGKVYFHYQKSPVLATDQIKAIEADPYSAKIVVMKINCKECNSEITVYTGLNRSKEIERDGATWYLDLQENFTCGCGKTTFDLLYLKESMHGLLLKDVYLETSGLSYVRRYGHQQVVSTVAKFNDLLDVEKLEQPIQRFIEENPILLSRFSAKRLFVKPNIVGRFAADFAILDSKNRLWFIELERPTIKLFKKDRHPTADLMHAFEQVNDWLEQYNKYSGAILDALDLKASEIVSTSAAVIAGRKKSIPIEVLQRFSSNPPYPNIEFLTLDDLGESLLLISRKLA